MPSLPFHQRPVVAVAAGAVLALAAGGVAVAQGDSSSSGSYRTTTVDTQTVDQTLDRIGSIEPVSQASLGFATDGTVASVSVQVGDTVTVGQELAKLDTTSLESAVADAQATLDAAELTLERALNGEDVSGSTGDLGNDNGIAPASSTDDATANSVTLAAYTASTTGEASVSEGGGADDVTLVAYRRPAGSVAARADDPELAAAQQAVLDAQQTVDTNLTLAQQALDDAQTICANLPTTSTPTTDTTDTTDTTVPAGDSGSDAVAACQSALVAVLDAQQVVADSQNALADASRALDDLLAQRAEDQPDDPGTVPPTTQPQQQTGNPPDGGTTPQQGDQQVSGDLPSDQDQGTGDLGDLAGGGTTDGASSSPSSADLIAYQKAVDAATAELAVAEQAAAQASVVSPIAGTVQTVGIAPGDSVSSGSSTAAVVVRGEGGYEATTTVTVDDMPDLEVGQAVTVTPDGIDDAVTGQVVGIGTVGTSSGSSTTYPVTIGLTDPPDDLRNGVTASLSIVTDETDDAIAVPTSAVTVENGQATVTVLDGGETSAVTVETGAVGATWTEITDGLEEGETVVLADLDEPLPSSATDSSSSDNGGGGFDFPGGGTGPRVFPGG